MRVYKAAVPLAAALAAGAAVLAFQSSKQDLASAASTHRTAVGHESAAHALHVAIKGKVIAGTHGRGHYIGPATSGRCGVVPIGPGMEQGSAITAHGVSCAMARQVVSGAWLARGSRRSSYGAAGFTCTSTTAGTPLVRYSCKRAAGASISFEVA